MGYLTASGLASASGLNAYIPLLILGVVARYTDLVTVPAGWDWITNGWVLAIVALLLIIEIFADKIPALDTVNDVIQTVIRPTSGGVVFASGVGTVTPMSQAGGEHSTWISLAVGAIIAFIFHSGKTLSRPAANVSTAGLAAPVVSTVEDIFAALSAVVAIFLPVLVVVMLLFVAVTLWWFYRRLRRRKARL